eukprot:CAMPEP_0113638554 /NCGR_PEP_ID=MMETSP0017_2-20120614/20201_1 /TAXON_ID=2856 /ORGANISM="Cylindrotheca closterium" /LENGTH=267 /DNA_ID=CAMNT_0000549675 /DNA_START=8 /DNA_END=811 /DNA_ORIENTATION=- /assembly_acc=CAM_ASM_000147
MKFFSLSLIATLLAAATAIDEELKQQKPILRHPHLITWKNDHIQQEYLGQCDLVMVHDGEFADGLGLDIHIRTKTAGSWSYIKSVSIKIGMDVLEIEGSPNPNDEDAHYWYNGKYQEDLQDMAGFPVEWSKPTEYTQQYNIDLDLQYPGKGITIDLFNQFIRIKLDGDESVFGNTVGLLGDFRTGKKLARDGASELNDVVQLSDEWQVLPSEPRIFHEVAHPQFPENCIRQEHPLIVAPAEQAEVSCSRAFDDPTLIKECISYAMSS